MIGALADPRYSVQTYIKDRGEAGAKHALRVLIQTYGWLLERHRRKAIGAIGVVLAGGRTSTAGGANQAKADRATALPVDEMLNRQMISAAAERTDGFPRTLMACVTGTRLITPRTLKLTLGFLTPVPLRAGDRVYIWPENTTEAVHIAAAMVCRLRPEATETNISRRQIEQALRRTDLHHLHRLSELSNGPKEELSWEHKLAALPKLRPRAYSVAQIEAQGDCLAKRVDLTIGLPDGPPGPAVAYLRTLSSGADVHLEISPMPLFHLAPEPHVPLVMVGQGAGVGPLYGFVSERARQAASAPMEWGEIALFVAARRAIDVPYLTELTQLTEQLPLTLTLALTQERGRSIKAGMVSHFATTLRINDALHYESGPTMRGLLSGGHMYTCGGVDFGHGVRKFVDKLLQPHLKLGAAREALTRRYHEDLFSQPLEPHASAVYSAQELALHNKPHDLWSSFGGFVYDLTDYARSHPGGFKVLMEIAGGVGDRRFQQIHGGPHNQEIWARMAPYKVGMLENWPTHDVAGLSNKLHNTLNEIVTAQNILRNNTQFLAQRDPPFYVSSNALLVTVESALPRIWSHLRGGLETDDLHRSLVDGLNGFKTAAQDRLRQLGLGAEKDVLRRMQELVDKMLKVLEDAKAAVGNLLNHLTPMPPAEAQLMLDTSVLLLKEGLETLARQAAAQAHAWTSQTPTQAAGHPT